MYDLDRTIEKLQKLLDERPEPDEEHRTEENNLRLRLANAIGCIKECKQIRDNDELQIKNQRKVIRNLDRFIGNFGFKKVNTGYNGCFYHNGLPYCDCGNVPQIVYVEDDDEWCVMCQKCYLMTAQYKKIKDAMKAWGNSEFTETSLMLHKPLTKENVDDDGLMDLAKAICETAAEDYIEGTDRTKESLKKFFLTSHLMLGADGEAALKNLDKISEERRMEKLEKEGKTA